jgi:cytidylate kinase
MIGATACRKRSPGMTNRHVAIDGPVASGKTVAARALAAALGHLYLDTGAMYRAAAYLALHNGVDLDNERAILSFLERHRIRLVADEAASAGYRVEIDGVDTGSKLFDPEVSSAVSTVAALPGVRAALVAEQRAIAHEGPVVMAGRDIGTVVLPDARFKFYLTASVDERADRRAKEFAERGLDVGIDEVRVQIVERDRLDENRATSPLRPADDARIIDSTSLQAADVLAQMRAIIAAGT